MIHPPMQGGDVKYGQPYLLPTDTPSHTGRKQENVKEALFQRRYTLPCREETNISVDYANSIPIHPPIQGGNVNETAEVKIGRDTPSRTGRNLF